MRPQSRPNKESCGALNVAKKSLTMNIDSEGNALDIIVKLKISSIRLFKRKCFIFISILYLFLFLQVAGPTCVWQRPGWRKRKKFFFNFSPAQKYKPQFINVNNMSFSFCYICAFELCAHYSLAFTSKVINYLL